jgi:hypothetical protein
MVDFRLLAVDRRLLSLVALNASAGTAREDVTRRLFVSKSAPNCCAVRQSRDVS